MTPEQLQGEVVDARSDIFSFGVMLFETLTNQFPFQGEYESALIYSILNDEPQAVQSFRSDPRYQELLKRLHLDQYQ